METKMKTLKEMAKDVELVVRHGALKNWDKQDKWQKNSNSYRLSLKYKGKSFSFDFWQGVGIKEDPQVYSVLDCLLSDASCAQDSFEDFCANCGYDTDSRKAFRTYKQIEQQTKRLKRLLGDDFEAFLYADRD